MRLGTAIHYRASISAANNPPNRMYHHLTKLRSNSTFTVTVFHLTFYLIVFGYLYMGAVVFYHIEAAAEMEEIMKQEKAAEAPTHQSNFYADKISDIAKMMAVKYRSDRRMVESLLKDFVVELKFQGLEIKESPPPNEPQEREIKMKWDFPSSFLFAFTILTTIGYGNIAPATVAGKLFTMIYAFIGIPMFLVALIDIGAFAQQGISGMIDAVKQKCTRRKNKEDTPKDNKKANRNLALQKLAEFSCTMMAFAAYILFGAALLPIWESHLSLFTACYYAFITITAIGFGDIVPQNMTLLPLTLIYITLGLWFALIVTEQIADLFKLIHFAGRTLTGVKDLKVWIGGSRVTVGNFIDAVGARAGVPEHVMDDIDWDDTVNEVAAGKNPTKSDIPLVPETVATPIVEAQMLPKEPKPSEVVLHAKRSAKVQYKNVQASRNERKEVQGEQIFSVYSIANSLPRSKSTESISNLNSYPPSTLKKVETVSYFSNTEEWIEDPYATNDIARAASYS